MTIIPRICTKCKRLYFIFGLMTAITRCHCYMKGEIGDSVPLRTDADIK